MLKQKIHFLANSGSVLRQVGVLTMVASIVSAGLALSVAHAEEYTVKEETTVTNGAEENVLDGEDSLTVEKDGAITISGDVTSAVSATGNKNEIVNNGEIATKGEESRGIAVRGNENTITNKKKIDIEGYVSSGFNLVGNGNKASNSGTISVKGPGAQGVAIANGFNIRGNIVELVPSNENTFSNSGTINVEGPSALGMVIEGNQNKITNTGNFNLVGDNAIAFGYDGNRNTLDNAGRVAISGQNAIGVQVNGDGNVITNKGSITTDQGKAIELSDTATNTVLNLHTSGFLAGEINTGVTNSEDGSTNKVNIIGGRASSLMWRITGDIKDGELAVRGSAPLFVHSSEDGTTHHVAGYDPTALAGSIDMLGAVSGNAASLIRNRFGADRASDADSGWWMSGLFSSGSYTEDKVMLDYDTRQASGAIGYDAVIVDGLTLGAMVGYGTGSLEAEGRWMNAHDNEASGLMGAVYARNLVDRMFVDLALSGGSLSHSDKRYVNDNTVAGGIATAKADYDSWWLSPEIGIGFDLEEKAGDWQLTPSARIRYARQSIDGFTETGIATADGNAKVADRTIGMVETRMEIAASKPMVGNISPSVKDGKVTFRLGWQTLRAMGDDAVKITLLGDSQNVSYKMDTRNSAYVGSALSMKLDNGMALNLGGEVSLGSGNRQIRATLGLKRAF